MLLFLISYLLTLCSSPKGLFPLLFGDDGLSPASLPTSEIGRKLILISPSICLAGEDLPVAAVVRSGATVSMSIEFRSENGDGSPHFERVVAVDVLLEDSSGTVAIVILFKNVEPTEKAGDAGPLSLGFGDKRPSLCFVTPYLEKSVEGIGGLSSVLLGDDAPLGAGEFFTVTTAALARTTVAVAASGDTMALLRYMVVATEARGSAVPIERPE